MTTLLPFLAAGVLAFTAWVVEADPSATHIDERPPNDERKVAQNFNDEDPVKESFHLTVWFAPYPSERATPTEEPTPVPTPAPTLSPGLPNRPMPSFSAAVGQLTEAEMRAILSTAGWPSELHDEALSVACGIGNASHPSGESGCRPAAANGCCSGLFQLHRGTWARYCGVAVSALLDAVTNAACAYRVYRYDIDRGQAPWTQWQVKP